VRDKMIKQISVVIITITIAIFVGCTNKQPAEKNNGTAIKAENISEILNVTKRSGLVPNFSWKDKDGKTVDFDNFKGKVTLINFWATWCGPCQKEIPDLITLNKEMTDKNVKILGVSTDRGTNVLEDVRQFISEKGINYQNLISNEDLEEAFGNIRVIPTSFIVDSEGKIVQTIVGMRSKEQFAEAINAAMK